MVRRAALFLLLLTVAGSAAAGDGKYVIVSGTSMGVEVSAGNGDVKRGNCGGAYFAGSLFGHRAPAGPCGYGRVVLLPADGQLKDLADAITDETNAYHDVTTFTRDLSASERALRKLLKTLDKASPARTSVEKAIELDARAYDYVISGSPGVAAALRIKRSVLNDLIERGLIVLPKDEFSETTTPARCEALAPVGEREVCTAPEVHMAYLFPGGRGFHPSAVKVESVVSDLGPTSRPMGATVIDGNVWVTDFNNCKLDVFGPDGKSKYTISVTPGSGPSSISPGAAGSVWWTGQGDSTIGERTKSGNVRYFSLPKLSQPQDITAGGDGRMWFTLANGNAIGAIAPGGKLTEFKLPHSLSFPAEITSGSDGALWFTEQGRGTIGRITTDGVLHEYPLPDFGSQPTGITSGYGSVWFTTLRGNTLGRIDTGGKIQQWPMPTTDSGPSSVAVGPNGTLAIAEPKAKKIAWFRVR